MDLPLYQQLQLSPPSPKASDHQSFLYYHSSPAFAADAFHQSYIGTSAGAGVATPPPAEIDSPTELLLMDQAPAPTRGGVGNAQGLHCGVGLDSAAAAAARKDRHSKICTAGGMRDRRMRLSLDVARKFFALQDMLGFDKASKTVQWLLNMSKGAIREVMTDETSSDCEEDGSSSLSVVDGKNKPPALELGGADHAEGKKPAARARRTPANPKPQRKLASAHPIPDKESRTKARERARERTREKHLMKWATRASTIHFESPAGATVRAGELIMSPSNLNSSSSRKTASTELEERCSSSMPSETSDAIMTAGFSNGGYVGGGSGSYYEVQLEQQWELGGVVFANSRLY